jgi:uncharacterized membrane protein YedE/YeeE
MNFPLGNTGILSGLLLGLIFGVVLENAGFGTPCKTTAQLQFKDWTVFKVMFTAIIVAAIGLYTLQALGVVALSDLFVPSVYFWGTLIGGVGVGIGMAVGGYCPGTSMASLFSGRIDALFFLVGIGLGTIVFDLLYPLIGQIVYAQTGPSAWTLPQLLHLPGWAVLALLTAVLVTVGYLTRAKLAPASPNRSIESSLPIAIKQS